MVRRYNLYADGKRFFISRGDHGLALVQDACLRLPNMQDTTFCIVM
jgi:hypothetical protein